jgi:hypothetical protein
MTCALSAVGGRRETLLFNNTPLSFNLFSISALLCGLQMTIFSKMIRKTI